ncbi:MAG: hypothetical protein H6645_13520 [Caldilineaceae bacterium]|nr:hypothetical protein [Caldilineaceae bacterium]
MMIHQSGQRHLPLPGAYNIRDVGGYSTSAGRTNQLFAPNNEWGRFN